ncbi:DNA polymerase III subunit delta [Kaistella pullorum]|uniref:DNA polymerase III subunit delta n=1 Tax=Kaistella pullorum TaxID=2763074 RepID=A0ABR8WLL6_9FLAO|nr:DNA polymerase III subunit delta [Kaistella pullorum]MBD8017919.1 DNA polymerase III subunit delta [Kaistella pullorum]
MKDLDSILKNIKNKELLPIYFFHGEEPYYIDVAIKSFENDVLEEDEKAFNQTVVYGKDTTFSDVLSLARQFPMMGDRQVIILKEAQEIKLTEKESEALKVYAQNPVPCTLLVIAYKYKKVDARKAFAKTLSKNKMLFLSEKMYDSDVPKFIDQQIRKLGLRTKPNIPALLSEYLGTDLSRISNELSKLKMILKDTDVLDEKIIETHIGISKDFNTFELTKTLAHRDAAKAMRVAYFLGKSAKQSPFEMIMGSLYSFFSNLIIYHTLAGKNPKLIQEEMKLNYYQVEDLRVAAANYSLKHATRIISVLREFDMKRKGLGAVNMNETQLLTEMTYKILNVAQLKVKV